MWNRKGGCIAYTVRVYGRAPSHGKWIPYEAAQTFYPIFRLSLVHFSFSQRNKHVTSQEERKKNYIIYPLVRPTHPLCVCMHADTFYPSLRYRLARIELCPPCCNTHNRLPVVSRRCMGSFQNGTHSHTFCSGQRRIFCVERSSENRAVLCMPVQPRETQLCFIKYYTMAW